MRPIKETFVVEQLSDGKFVAPGPYYGGRDMDMGPSACLRIGDVRVVVSSHKAQLADQAMYRYVGIEPTEQAILVNKSSVHFRADFEPIAETLLICAAPGAMPADTAALPWTRLRPGIRIKPNGPAFVPDQSRFHVFCNRITNMPNIERIDGFADELTAIRRDLHAHPEIGFEEVRTSGIVAEKLTQWGIEVHRGLGGTGVVGVLKGKGDGAKRIGLRADMDALPMEENTNLRWRSTIPGRFHGCGHDGHTTMLLGTARYLAETRNFDGTVHFIFQPAEEGLGGARAMIKDGLFEKFPCDEVYGLHNAPDLNHGEIADPPRPRDGRRRFLRHHHRRLWRAWRDAGTLKGSRHHRDDARRRRCRPSSAATSIRCRPRCCRSPRSTPAPPITSFPARPSCAAPCAPFPTRCAR